MLENEGFKFLWDFNVQCDRIFEARRLETVFVDKQAMEIKIIDMAIPGDARVKDEELRPQDFKPRGLKMSRQPRSPGVKRVNV